MNFLNMSNEKVEALEKEAEKRRQTVIELQNMTPEDMWRADLYELKQVSTQFDIYRLQFSSQAWDAFCAEWMAERDDAEKEADETREREAKKRGRGRGARSRAGGGRGRANADQAGPSNR